MRSTAATRLAPVPLVFLRGKGLPPETAVLGHSRSQLTKCFLEGNALRSRLTSVMTVCAPPGADAVDAGEIDPRETPQLRAGRLVAATAHGLLLGGIRGNGILLADGDIRCR